MTILVKWGYQREEHPFIDREWQLSVRKTVGEQGPGKAGERETRGNKIKGEYSFSRSPRK